MDSEEFQRRLDGLQEYVPFLENMISQLKQKDPTKTKSEQQLGKIGSLLAMIVDKKKKWKPDTLIKCENVLKKLHSKVKPNDRHQHDQSSSSNHHHQKFVCRDPPELKAVDADRERFELARAKLQEVAATPRSPSPVREAPRVQPIVIPTEKVTEKCVVADWSGEKRVEKPDVYGVAAISLLEYKEKRKEVAMVDMPDMSKPPISLEDLRLLEEDVPVVEADMSLDELEGLREKIQKELTYDGGGGKSTNNIKTKVAKETSVFGNVLTSIDDMLLSDKKKNQDRRKSVDTNKDKKPQKETTYKRLADKYNPKPRKPSVDTDEINEKPNSESFPIPCLEKRPPTPPKGSEVKVAPKILDPRIKSAPETSDTSGNIDVVINRLRNVNPGIFTKPPLMSPPNAYSSFMQPYNYPKQPQHIPTITQRNYYPNYNYQQQQQQSKAFNPYEPIAPPPPQPKQDEYDLSKMEPVEFYPPQASVNAGGVATPVTTFKSPPRTNQRFDPRMKSWKDPRKTSQKQGKKQRWHDKRQDFRERSRHDAAYSRMDPRVAGRGEGGGGSFLSPLDSLYGGSGETRSGYGVHKFRIPKIKKVEEESGEKKVEEVKVEEASKKVEDGTKKAEEPIKRVEEAIKKVEEPIKTVEEPVKVEEVKKVDEGESKKVEEPKKVVEEPKKSVEEEERPSSADDKTGSDQSMLVSFLAKLIENKNKQDDLVSLFNKIADSLSNQQKKKFKRIQRFVDSDSSEEDTKPPPEEPQKSPEPPPATPAIEETKPEQPQTTPTTPAKTKKKPKPETIDDDRDLQPLETVGERIKNRKRHKPEPIISQKQPKRSELDLLHADIKDMFIRDGVLTATGKRMCRLLKDDPESMKLETAKKNAKRNNPCVVLEKTDLSKLVTRRSRSRCFDTDDSASVTSSERSTSPRRSLRSRNVKVAYKSEEEEEEEEEEEPTSSSSDEEASEKPVKKSKKKSNWSLGKLTKKKKVNRPETPIIEPEVTEPTPPIGDFEYVEHDLEYYPDPSIKMDCKLCYFSGKMLVQHYKIAHPNNEVLISRLQKNIADKLIRESLYEDYASITPSDIYEAKSRRKKFNFTCAICLLPIFDNAEVFYDHIASHTGEYRFECDRCHFKTANCKSLRTHRLSSHNLPSESCVDLQGNRPPPPNFSMVFAYICNICNYVQLSEDMLVRHLKGVHNDDGKIYKISMSMDGGKRVEVEEKEAEVSEEEVEGVAKIKSVKGLKPGKVGGPKRKSKNNEENIFTCDSALIEDEKKVEEERKKRMQEINEQIKFTRTNNVAGDLLTRIVEKQQNIEIKQDVSDTEDNTSGISWTPPQSPTTLKETIKLEAPPKSDAETKAAAKPTLEPKNNAPITDTIQRLQGNLTKVPELRPISSLTPITCTKDVVLFRDCFELRLKDDRIVYSCTLPSCIFATDDSETFGRHAKHGHSSSKLVCHCELCKVDYESMDGLFRHVVERHLEEFVKKGSTVGEHVEHVEEQSDELPFKIVSVTGGKEEEEGFKLPLISNVVSLAEEETVSRKSLSPPPLSLLKPVKAEPPKSTSKIVLKDHPIPQHALKEPRKSKEALYELIKPQNIINLYKCPSQVCPYSTNVRNDFDSHLKTHKEFEDTLAKCVYCNFCNNIEHVSLHIDVRHSKSLYSCAYCLFRGVNQSYVHLHQNEEHESLPKRIYKLPVIGNNNISVRGGIPKPNLKELFSGLLYVCGIGDCRQKFLLESVFDCHLRTHLTKKNQSFTCQICHTFTMNLDATTKAAIVRHFWDSHNIGKYVCRYCTSCWNDFARAYKHVALNHSSLPLDIVVREFKHEAGKFGVNDFKLEDDTFYERLQHMTREMKDYVDPLVLIDLPMAAPPTSGLVAPPTQPATLLAISPTNSGAPATPVLLISAATVLDKLLCTEPVVQLHIKENVENVNLKLNEPTVKEAVKPPTETTSTPMDLSEESMDNEEMVVEAKKEGLVGKDLFRCGNCPMSFEESQTFRNHLMKCIAGRIGKQFKCYHCSKYFRASHSLAEHIRSHGASYYFCSLCDYKHQQLLHLRNHMKSRHKVPSISTVPVEKTKTNVDTDNFIVRPKLKRKVSSDASGATNKEPTKSEETKPDQPTDEKLTFTPSEIDQLPRQPISNRELRCAICNYATKVRTNLVRHLEFHTKEKEVPNSAPVNPVPCLDKSEKMFDKMINLAFNSVTTTSRVSDKILLSKEEEAQMPAYVVSTKRYVCGVASCNYLCLEESNLRHHIQALHVDEQKYVCTHCGIVVSGDATGKASIDVDEIGRHLRLHDQSLYKCGYCRFLHPLRHKVEWHLTEKHLDKNPVVVVVREKPSEEPTEETTIKEVKPWKCGLCKLRTTTRDDILLHISNNHEIGEQYKCALCRYASCSRDSFTPHFETEHPGHPLDVIETFYHNEQYASKQKSIECFDTTPIWQRDKQRVRHIRGILFEESGKLPKKSPVKVQPEEEEEEEAERKVKESEKKVVKGVKRGREELAVEGVVIKRDRKCKEESTIEGVVVKRDKKISKEESVVEGLIVKRDKKSSKEEPVVNEDVAKKINTGITKGTDNLSKVIDAVARGTESEAPPTIDEKIASLNRELSNIVDNLVPPFATPTDDEVILVDDEDATKVITLDSDDEDKPQTPTGHQSEAKRQKLDETTPIVDIVTSSGQEAKRTSPVAKCQHCEYTSKNPRDVRRHEKRHWAQKPLRCGHCDFEAITPGQIVQHSKSRHKGLETNVVHVPMPSQPTIVPLARKASGKVAPKASSTGVSSSTVGEDGEVIEEAERPPEDTPTKSDIYDFCDEIQATTNVKYKCNMCDLYADNVQSLTSHVRSHIQPFECDYCKERFAKLVSVRAHLDRAHSEDPPSYNKIAEEAEKCKRTKDYISMVTSDGSLTPLPYTKQKTAHRQMTTPQKEAIDGQSLLVVKKAVPAAVGGVKPTKQTARKSTSKVWRPCEEEYSFYGLKPEAYDPKTTMTTVVVSGIEMKLSVEQVSHTMALNPVVLVEDCCAGRKEPLL